MINKANQKKVNNNKVMFNNKVKEKMLIIR